MPELETRIQEWKQSLAAAFGGSEEIVEELESHLREEIDRQVRAGQEPLAAFERAQAQFGRPTDLVGEYARAVPSKRWLPIYFCFALALVCFGLFAWAFSPRLLRDPLLGLHVAALVAGYTTSFAAGLLGICYVARWLVKPIGLAQRRALGRAQLMASASTAVLLVLGIALGSVWMHVRGRTAWSNDPREICTSIAAVWFAALAAGYWRMPRKQHTWALLNIVGVGVGVWGWCGFTLFENNESYNSTPITVVLIASSILFPALALLGMLPAGHLRRRTA